MQVPFTWNKIMKNFLIVFIFISLQTSVWAQPKDRMTHAEYIQKYKDDAIRDMQKMGVPASITLAQGILESDAGNSRLAREANNHFGIKCHTDWNGPTFIQDDDTKDECFRKYRTVLDSYVDHGRFLRERPRYAFLFEYDITDYKKWAHGLKKAGYATNPKYADLLIRIIEENNLDAFDRGGHNLPVDKQGEVADSKPAQTKPNTPVPNRKNTSAGKTRTRENANQVPYMFATPGDTWYSLAVKNEMRLWQILKYNDASESDILKAGDIVYLKPKRGNPDQKTHIVSNGENLRMISQQYGIKLKKLIKLNHLNHNLELHQGQQIRLK